MFINRKHTEATKEKMRLARVGIVFTQEHKDNIKKNHSRAWLGKKHTEEQKRKISLGNKGKIFSQETREKIRLSRLGKKASEETKIKLSLAKKGVPKSESHILGMIRGARRGKDHPMFGKTGAFKGKHHTKESKQKLSLSKKGKPMFKTRGEKCHLWKGGITPVNQKIKSSLEWRIWREAVYVRDNYTCQKCKVRGGITLHPHHILNFSQYPELRFAIDNGITFCKKCHIYFHKLYGRQNNTREQVKEFLSTN